MPLLWKEAVSVNWEIGVPMATPSSLVNVRGPWHLGEEASGTTSQIGVMGVRV